MTKRWAILIALAVAVQACGDCTDGSAVINNGDNNGNLDGGTSDAGSDGSGPSSDGGGEPDQGGDVGDCAQACGDLCCGAAEECVDGACLVPCAGTRCGEGFKLCCAGEDVCLFESCVTPGADCEFNEECDPSEFCEPTLGKCVPRDQVEICEFIPPVGDFNPSLGCSWPGPAGPSYSPDSRYVVVAPIVGNLTDDNGDGLTNRDDVPEIVFLSRTNGCCNKRGTLRIVSGECNADQTMNTIASLDAVLMANDAAPALGDLDGDGVPEIVAIKGQNLNTTSERLTPQGLVAWKRVTADGASWEPMWENDTYPTNGVHTLGGPAVSIADLDADSMPEVIVGNVVVNGQDGTLKWDGVATSGGTGGIGNNAFLGPSSSVGDLDGDGLQEVAAGNTLYAHDGTVLWTYPYTTDNSPCGGNLPCDGFTAMADFDGDPEGEVIIIRRGEAYVLNHEDGSLVWKQPIIKDDCANNESGPPTVADFDGDGRPEIGTAAADYYTVMDMDCDADDWMARGCVARGVLWATPNNDCSSRVTASSVFDFEGDGKAEMVYADEQNFRIFDGTTGAILFDDPTHSSNTRLEMPLVADVDNDGNSEIVIPSATDDAIKVWQDSADNWVRTRRIWNQHAYSVTNVTEDGEIPAVPQQNWANPRLNNFRQNVQPDDLFLAPNLVVESVEVRGVGCGDTYEVSIRVRVKNKGSLGVPAGAAVRITGMSGADVQVIADETTSQRLLPGQSETFVITWEVPAQWVMDGFTIDAVIDPDGTVNECIEDDNAVSFDGADVMFSAPELVVESVTADGSTCGTTGEVTGTVVVQNAGTSAVPANVPVVLVAAWSGTTADVTTFQTSAELQPGDSETFQFTWSAPQSARGRFVTLTATIDPNKEVYDCDEQNTGEVTFECKIVM